MPSFSEMSFEEQIDWAAGLILTKLIAGDLRTGVSLVMQQCFQLAYEHGRQAVEKKEPNYFIPDGVIVRESDLSERAITVLLAADLQTAADVREFLKAYGKKGLKTLRNCGNITANEIEDYFLYDLNNE